ncbi:AraC family ligand binding domain-containing protein [Candidatus Leptofilum sp.]|uniref:AraC family transcriptional regulator n=1 Tax=Candidatus Leptofilum sp. TaxID=3241576 RepID=UPI003B5B51B7
MAAEQTATELKKEKRKFWHHSQLDGRLLQAYHREYAYPRHGHDHYVICLIEQGVQSFTHKGTKYITPPSGLILINPGVIHTGESASEQGFQMRCLYPTMAHMQTAVRQLTSRHKTSPFFRAVRIDDPAAMFSVRTLHRALSHNGDPLEVESRFLSTLTKLINRYGELGSVERPLGKEHTAVQQAKTYLEESFDQPISLSDLAEHVALSPYYLLRVFHAEVGLPPHAYLQDVRVRRAQQLIELGRSLADIALAVGFSSQSHLTRRFKQVVGLTPGHYARQIQKNRKSLP